MFLTITDIKDIAATMQSKLGVEYTGYGLSFLKRRINYTFEKMNIHKIPDFYTALDDASKADLANYYMSVPMTEMFRDPAFWRALRKNIAEKTSLSVWFPDLTSADELYSFLIIAKQLKISNVKVVANVTSNAVIDNVKLLTISTKKEAVSRSNYERLTLPEPFDTYVQANDDNKLTVAANLLDGVKFRTKWFMNEQPEKYDIIIFRNVLLNYGPQLHEKVVGRLCESLADGALLNIGIKESLGVKVPQLSAVNHSEGIYGYKIK